jgi:hypothetical protein
MSKVIKKGRCQTCGKYLKYDGAIDRNKNPTKYTKHGYHHWWSCSCGAKWYKWYEEES